MTRCGSKAFLKKKTLPDDLDRLGNTMAQLVDGRAETFSHEYTVLFHSQACQVQDHPDWGKLTSAETRFVWKTFALLLFQSSSSFDRRVVAPLGSLPFAILSMGRVRHDLPDERRKQVAKLLLETPVNLLDVNSLKIRNIFKADLELARKSGKLGLRLFITIKSMRRVWKAEIRENERLNKQLKLTVERSPNSSLDLISARLGLKYRMGSAGLQQENMQCSKSRNWTRVRPMVANLFDTCLDHWFDAASVLSETSRFQEPGVPDWCPSRHEVHAWMPVLQPQRPSGDQASCLLFGLVNRSLYQFLRGKNTGKTQNASEFPEPYFSAVAVVVDDQLRPGRPYRLPSNSCVHVFCETVNRAVRLLRATWNGRKLILDQPWRFVWGADLLNSANIDASKVLNKNQSLKIIAFPVGWLPVNTASGETGLEGSCLSKAGDVSYVTITYWEQDPWTSLASVCQVNSFLSVDVLPFMLACAVSVLSPQLK